jgi:hypothetical protein
MTDRSALSKVTGVRRADHVANRRGGAVEGSETRSRCDGVFMNDTASRRRASRCAARPDVAAGRGFGAQSCGPGRPKPSADDRRTPGGYAAADGPDTIDERRREIPCRHTSHRARACRQTPPRASRLPRESRARGESHTRSRSAWQTPTASARGRSLSSSFRWGHHRAAANRGAQRGVGRLRLPGGAMQRLRHRTRGDGEGKVTPQQPRDLAVRQAEMLVEQRDEGHRPRPQMHRGRPQRIGCLQGMQGSAPSRFGEWEARDQAAPVAASPIRRDTTNGTKSLSMRSSCLPRQACSPMRGVPLDPSGAPLRTTRRTCRWPGPATCRLLLGRHVDTRGLERTLASSGWRGWIRTTGTFFLYGDVTPRPCDEAPAIAR